MDWKVSYFTLFGQTEATNSAWPALRDHYAEAHRHYHNADHIRDLLRQSHDPAVQLTRPDRVRAAIFYHDVIYSALPRKDNERRSAELAARHLHRFDWPAAEVAAVERYIRATADHRGADTGDDCDLDYFLDMDLAILGSEPDTYRAYARAIAREYRLVPGFLYRRGRRRVLEHFLQQERLFRSPLYRERYATAARKNLAWELSQL